MKLSKNDSDEISTVYDPWLRMSLDNDIDQMNSRDFLIQIAIGKCPEMNFLLLIDPANF